MSQDLCCRSGKLPKATDTGKISVAMASFQDLQQLQCLACACENQWSSVVQVGLLPNMLQRGMHELLHSQMHLAILWLWHPFHDVQHALGHHCCWRFALSDAHVEHQRSGKDTACMMLEHEAATAATFAEHARGCCSLGGISVL